VPDRSTRGARASRGGSAIVSGLLSLAVVACGSVPAQADDETEFDPLNFAFAAYTGAGIYTSDTGTVYLFRIPVNQTIVRPEERLMGVRLRLRMTFGFYDFDPEDLIDLVLPESVGTVSMLGGVEFPIRIYQNWTLGPFVDFGPAWDSDSDKLSWVLGTGARSRAHFPWKERRFVLWNELVVASNFADADVERDDFGKFMAELEFRQPIGWTIRDRQTALGFFVKGEWLFNELEIQRPTGEPVGIAARYEVGVKFSTAERERIWRVPLPRVGLGYRFGQGVTSVRLIFSSRY
jgi:hypothetical protein